MQLGVVFLVVLVFVTVLIAIVPAWSIFFSGDGKASGIAAILQGTVGIAAAIAGVWVTLEVALSAKQTALGALKIMEREEERDIDERVTDEIRQIIEINSDIVCKLRRLYEVVSISEDIREMYYWYALNKLVDFPSFDEVSLSFVEESKVEMTSLERYRRLMSLLCLAEEQAFLVRGLDENDAFIYGADTKLRGKAAKLRRQLSEQGIEAIADIEDGFNDLAKSECGALVEVVKALLESLNRLAVSQHYKLVGNKEDFEEDLLLLESRLRSLKDNGNYKLVGDVVLRTELANRSNVCPNCRSGDDYESRREDAANFLLLASWLTRDLEFDVRITGYYGFSLHSGVSLLKSLYAHIFSPEVIQHYAQGRIRDLPVSSQEKLLSLWAVADLDQRIRLGRWLWNLFEKLNPKNFSVQYPNDNDAALSSNSVLDPIENARFEYDKITESCAYVVFGELDLNIVLERIGGWDTTRDSTSAVC
jgi:hypothetical protein